MASSSSISSSPSIPISTSFVSTVVVDSSGIRSICAVGFDDVGGGSAAAAGTLGAADPDAS
jgi:hypothetical protein